MEGFSLLDGLKNLVPLVLSLTVHEWAHAWSARRLGDDTAERLGRLTLNPLVHIDPLGTLLMPMLVSFGWAKPVPVNPARFRPEVNQRFGMMITAAAGPLSHLVLAFLCVIFSGLMLRFSLYNEALDWLFTRGFQLNVLLALFNFLPIPPLDGSRVADGLMPNGLRPLWERFVRVGPILLLVLFMMPGLAAGILRWPHIGLLYLRQGLLSVILG